MFKDQIDPLLNTQAPSKSKIISTIIHDSSSFIDVELDGTNYRTWSKILQMHITGMKKKGYITGRKFALNDDDPTYDKWKVKDVLIKSWLINSMIDKLMSHFVQYEFAKCGM